MKTKTTTLCWLALLFALTTKGAWGQTAVRLPEQKQREEQAKAQSQQQEKLAQQANVQIVGNTAFNDKELRSQLKEQLSFIAENGLTSARADDAAFFLEIFYKKHGYAKVQVSYKIESGNRFRLTVSEGPLVHLGKVTFVGNRQITADKLFDYAVGPTRQRVSKAQAALPFVPSDLNEGADLVLRFYVSEGFAECSVDPPINEYVKPDLVNTRIVIHEGQKYFFGNVNFTGPTIYGAEALRGQILDLLRQPYTAARLEISRGVCSLTTRRAATMR